MKITRGRGRRIMGVYYKVANFTKKEIIDGYSAKLGEWNGNHFDQAVVVNYLINNKDFPMTIKFISDESGEWDRCDDAGFKDVTAEVLYSMFENGYFADYNKGIWNNKHIMKYILRKFQQSNMEKDFHEICDRIPEFAKFREEMVLVELER